MARRFVIALLALALLASPADAKKHHAVKKKIPKSPWCGDYVFLEAQNQAVLQYRLSVGQTDKGQLTAALNIDGYQTLSRWACAVKADKEEMQVLMGVPRVGNTGVPPRRNSVLFTVERDGPKLETHWYSLKPGLGKSAKTTRGFERTD